jgi:hypothetical protein
MENILATLLLVQGVLGSIDTLYNHELLERLPWRIQARSEVALHAVREAIYGLLFIGLAWFAWYGAWASIPAVFLGIQVLVDAADEFVENKSRVLPQNERVLHFFIVVNLGLITAALAAVLFTWASQPTGVVKTGYGLRSWLLSALGLAGMAWAARDWLAWRRLGTATARHR